MSLDMWSELSWKMNGLGENRTGKVKINNVTVNVIEHQSDFPREAPMYEFKATSPSGKNVTDMFVDELFLMDNDGVKSAFLSESEVNKALEEVIELYR